MRAELDIIFVRMQIDILKDLVENPSDPNTTWRRWLPSRWMDWRRQMYYSAVDELKRLKLIHVYGVAGNITPSFRGVNAYNKMKEMEFNTSTFRWLMTEQQLRTE